MGYDSWVSANPLMKILASIEAIWEYRILEFLESRLKSIVVASRRGYFGRFLPKIASFESINNGFETRIKELQKDLLLIANCPVDVQIENKLLLFVRALKMIINDILKISQANDFS